MVTVPNAAHHIMLDSPLAFVGVVRGILGVWYESGSTMKLHGVSKDGTDFACSHAENQARVSACAAVGDGIVSKL